MDQLELVDNISEHFNRDELKELYFALKIRFDDVAGETRSAKSRELVAHCIRHNQIDKLITSLTQSRPNINWFWSGFKTGNEEKSKNLQELFSSAYHDAIMGNYYSALQKYQYIKEINPLYPHIDEELTKTKRATFISESQIQDTSANSLRLHKFLNIVATVSIIIFIGVIASLSWKNTTLSTMAITATYNAIVMIPAPTQEIVITTLHIQETVAATSTTQVHAATAQATATNTRIPTATSTATPTTTNTVTPTRSATPDEDVLTPTYSSFVLIRPENRGIQSQSPIYCRNDKQIRFEWDWERDLNNTGDYGGEYIAVQFGLVNNDTDLHTITWTKDNYYVLDTNNDIFNLEPGELYAWNIAVVEAYAQPENQNWITVDQSATWYFEYCGSDTQSTPVLPTSPPFP